MISDDEYWRIAAVDMQERALAAEAAVEQMRQALERIAEIVQKIKEA